LLEAFTARVTPGSGGKPLATTAKRATTGGVARVDAGGPSLGAPLRVAALVACMLGLAGALVFAVVAMRSPFVAASAPPGGLRCERVEILEVNALCYTDAVAFRAMPELDRAALAEKTLLGLSGKGATQLTVYGASDEGVLEVYDDVTFAVLKSGGRR
jgi:hypothetical protein